MPSRSLDELCDAARIGFSSLDVLPRVQVAALDNLRWWLSEPYLAAYQPQLRALIDGGRWTTLLNSFYQVLPFGTGGRRGTVGIGTNRFNAWSLGASAQGHAARLQRCRAHEGRTLSVVVAHDVRVFRDLGGAFISGVPNPVLGMSSRDFAAIAAEVYAATDVTVWLPPDRRPMSTPELSFAIRYLGADGGLAISASHDPPDDNGGKFYNHTGAQDVPPRDEEMAGDVHSVGRTDRMQFDRARAAGLVREMGPDVHEAYLQANLDCGRHVRARSAKIVFTGLHGTGRFTVAEVLQRAGFSCELEPTQSELDGAFPNVPFRVPDPAVPRSMDAAVAHAERLGADLVMACDPDADRLGLTVREHLLDPSATDPARWRFVSGNEIAVLLCHYLLTDRAFVAAPLVVKSEVTTTLLTRIARSHGARVIEHLLVGFEYIGDGLAQLEDFGRFAGVPAGIDDFVLGAEESNGVLVTPAVRDQDAAGGALLLAELASIEKDHGRTLVDTLRDLWQRHGYVRNELISTVMRGAAGRARIAEIQRRLREAPPAEISGRKVTAFHDRQDPAGPFGPIRSETDRASRDLLVFQLGPDVRLASRVPPAEDCIRTYVEVAETEHPPLDASIRRVNHEARQLAVDFTIDALAMVGIQPPRWTFRASDLLSVEDRVHFSDLVLPDLVERLTAAGGEPTSSAVRWLDGVLAGYGPGARDLLADAVLKWADDTHSSAGPALRTLFAPSRGPG